MERTRRPSVQAIAVLRALGQAPGKWRFGYDLCKETGLKSGSMYPILMRLADRGLLETMWESNPPAGRPSRHMYRLTGEGRAAAAKLTRPSLPRGRALRSRLRPRATGAS